MDGCITCEWVARRDRNEAPLWDSVQRTSGWDVVHAQGTSLPGWVCLVTRRHVATVAELTDEEAAELGRLIVAVSRALPKLVDAAKTYVVQFAEHPLHAHVHFHVIPRAADIPVNERGPNVFFTHLGVDASREVPESEKNRIAAGLRSALASSPRDAIPHPSPGRSHSEVGVRVASGCWALRQRGSRPRAPASVDGNGDLAG